MRDVEDDLIDGRIEDVVERDGGLQKAEIRPHMPAMCRDAGQHRLAQLVAERVKLVDRNLLQGLWPGNFT